jgi:hypothetical protein
MKFAIVFLLPAIISAATLFPRQEKTTFKTEVLTPKFRSNAKRTKTIIGPFKLLAGVSSTN